ncbi:MNR2 (YKL064W) [Zygosaccharomyces parabailii]|nr:MNR2 (YKL064W) [Zygosaccharomyces parabailii]CDH16740.1 related to Manganese resistance protein MNR2 [Zygosaccharomyces bailii ISA1307]
MTDNTKHESQPLLSPKTTRSSSDGSKSFEHDLLHHRKQHPNKDKPKVGSGLRSERGLTPLTDFDQADSWGLLHEADDSTSSKVATDKDNFIDHRPTLENMAGRSKSISKSVSTTSMSHHHKSSEHDNHDLFRWDDASERALLAKMSPSELEDWAKRDRLRSLHHGSRLKRSTGVRRRSTMGNDVVIDVDELMEHVKGHSSSIKSTPSVSTNKRGSSQGDGYNSRPSSRRSSNNSSLDDVCLYLEHENSPESKVWPDVYVLDDFCKEETERLRRQAVEDAEEFHFQYDDEDEGDEESGNNNNDGIFFSKPIVTSIDVPELGNKKVNEAEQLKRGRLRPKKLAPWHLRRKALMSSSYQTLKDHTKTEDDSNMRDNFLVGRNIQYPPHIVNNNPEHFRFTYFRVDLDSTVHSPTISGLLQPGQKFEELFVASVYTDLASKRHSGTPSGSRADILSNHKGSNRRLNSMAATTSELENVQPFWLDVLNPTEEEMKVLSKAFGIHPLTTEDIFLGEAREKVELFRDYYLVCFRSFDIVAERHTRKKKEKHQFETNSPVTERESLHRSQHSTRRPSGWLQSLFHRRRRSSATRTLANSSERRRRSELEKEEKQKYKRKSGDRYKPREGELEPLNVYIIVFKTGVLTFHFAPTPHPINVRRRARLLKDYLNVSADWIAYALIDDITDAFAPMIELIEDEVYDIEDAILRMHSSDDSSEEVSDDSDNPDSDNESFPFDRVSRRSAVSWGSRSESTRSSRSQTTGESTFNANLIGWKKKGDMLRRIGECRKRVMSILRLLGSKADVIKGFAKRCNERWDVAPRSEIGMYLGDIQDHIITMFSALNHYEKLLSRSHSNYLAQINIDMTKVNNDMNDVLGKITILGTVVLPMNVMTGLWGMNVLVPGQNRPTLTWFWGIFATMVIMAYTAYMYTKRRFGF